LKDPESFWADAARELDWFKPWDKVLEWDCPWAKWYTGGKINASYNCLDRHVKGGRKNKAAIIWEGEPGDERVLTYRDVWREVNKFANVLKKLGVKKGDRVATPAIESARPIASFSAASARNRYATGSTTPKQKF
jgi:acetyl-CoA synthetase